MASSFATFRRRATVSISEMEYNGVTATDADGDGVEDAQDNCPSVFNPIRPVDGGVQADHDSDGAVAML